MQEWSRLSVEQQLGSIICCAPIPVHPSLNPHQKVQMSHNVRFRRHLSKNKCSDIPTLSKIGKFMTRRIDLIENENPKTLNSHCAELSHGDQTPFRCPCADAGARWRVSDFSRRQGRHAGTHRHWWPFASSKVCYTLRPTPYTLSA